MRLTKYKTDFKQRMSITSEERCIQVVTAVRKEAELMGFDELTSSLIAAACSELAMNIVKYGDSDGFASIYEVADRPGILLLFEDWGPGIDDVEKALEDGHSASGTLGMGLPGVKRMMDTLDIETSPEGTKVETIKWRT